jgi:hypothetical protein
MHPENNIQNSPRLTIKIPLDIEEEKPIIIKNKMSNYQKVFTALYICVFIYLIYYSYFIRI